jgi:branched-chain amino acid transport system permease protein
MSTDGETAAASPTRGAGGGSRALVTVRAGSPGHRALRLIGIALIVVGALIVPFEFEPFRVGQFTLVLVWAVAALGLNLLVGYNGQISLGHGAFFAIGGYTTAILATKANVPLVATVPVAAAVNWLLGFAFGVPALRLRGLYLALVTLGLAVATPPVIKRFEGLTGGVQGLAVPPLTVPDGIPLDPDQATYLVLLVVAAVMFVLAMNLTRGVLGRAIMTVRENERAATTLGVDLAWVKTRVFAWSAAYAGVGGALYAIAVSFVAPESFPLLLSFSFLAAIVIGGLGTVVGALFGALFIEFVPQLAGDVNQALTGVLYGIALITVMYLLPGGAAGLLRRLSRRLVAVVEAPAAARPPGPGTRAAGEADGTHAGGDDAEPRSEPAAQPGRQT